MTRLRAALLAAGGAAATFAVARHTAPRGPWTRINHAGASVTLLEGPAYAVGAALGAAFAGPAPVVAAVGAAGFGLLDDLRGDGSSKGLKGHLQAARNGRITTGALKIAGLAATGVLAASLSVRAEKSSRAGLIDVAARGALIAGCANLANLLDLRPGRALKATLIAAAPLIVCAPGDNSHRFGAQRSRARFAVTAASASGAALGVLRPDLRGEAMLGDTGANAAGALIGVALSDGLSPRGRWAALLAVTGLTLASERISFTSVIESTSVLREIDAWGRATR